MKNYLNPQQKLAVKAHPGPLLIVAGAGTGKTRTLTSRLAYFIEKGVPPHKICAITFTNKAAKEMAGRVNVPSDSSRHGMPFLGTFHSLGARILRVEARLLDRGSNFVIFDDHDSFDLIKKITKKFFPKGGQGGRRRSSDAPTKVGGRSPDRFARREIAFFFCKKDF
ncbi:MAG: UvrD-helicase domain-containing protein [Candidatus Liptonbacteria bacterium]|nr:UvrD-helicase domain-containing protein [Candidatus Liptonbacteria bacterium]